MVTVQRRLVTFLLAALIDGTAGSASSAVVSWEAPDSASRAVPADLAIGATVSSLSELPHGDQLIVRYATYSCFHIGVYDFAFQRGAVLSVTVDLVLSGPAGVRDPRRLAILAVTDSAGTDLDEVVRLHRQAVPRPSTGGVRLELTQIRDGSVVAREVLANKPIIRRLGSYGFWELAYRARCAAPATALSGEYR